MRSRGANVLSSTCAASTAVSSSSSKANSGTLLSTSGLHVIKVSLGEEVKKILFSVSNGGRIVLRGKLPRLTGKADAERSGAVLNKCLSPVVRTQRHDSSQPWRCFCLCKGVESLRKIKWAIAPPAERSCQ